MSTDKKAKQFFCAICAHDIKTASCPHPWSKPFDKWPEAILEKLLGMLSRDPSPGS